MNIMFAFTMPIVPYVGGVQRVTSILSRELQRRGCRVVYLAFSPKNSIESIKVRDYSFDAPQYYIELIGRSSEEISAELRSIISNNDIEYVVCQCMGKDLIEYLPKGVKLISVCHILPYHTENITRKRINSSVAKSFTQRIKKVVSLILPCAYIRRYNRIFDQGFNEAFALADKVCFLSERFYPRLIRHLPNLPHEKLCAINNPNTFDVSSITVPQDKENIILWVGRVSIIQKNTIGFLKMWQLLSKDNPNWRVIVIGDGEDLVYCKNFASLHKLERIEFLGQRNDVANFYAKARFIAITSFWEGWCMVLTEAMAYGCVPCVYDTYESLHDIVDDGRDGMIVPPSAKSMADRIQSCIDNPQMWTAMSDAAHEKVKTFAVDHIVDQWEALLKSI